MLSTSRLPMSCCRTLAVLLFCCGIANRVAPQTASKPQFKAAVNLVRITVIARDVRPRSLLSPREIFSQLMTVGHRALILSCVLSAVGRRASRAGLTPRKPLVSRTVHGTVRPEAPDTSSLPSTRWVGRSGRTARRSSPQDLPLDILPFARHESSCNRAIYVTIALPSWDLGAWSRISLRIEPSCCGHWIRSQRAYPIRPICA